MKFRFQAPMVPNFVQVDGVGRVDVSILDDKDCKMLADLWLTKLKQNRDRRLRGNRELAEDSLQIDH